MPEKFSSAPIGRNSAWALPFSFVRMSSIDRWKSAPTRSILLMKASLGTLYLLAWRQTVSDWGCTPATASNTATAPSRTRRERSTSAVKSTWPGVSMMLMRCLIPFHGPTGGVPGAGDGGRGDRDPALALLLHPVGHRGALVDLAHLVDGAGVEEDALGRGRLAGVDVRGDADVARPLERERAVRRVLRGDLGLVGDDSDGRYVDGGHGSLSDGYQRRWAKARFAWAILWVSSFFFTTVPVLL